MPLPQPHKSLYYVNGRYRSAPPGQPEILPEDDDAAGGGPLTPPPSDEVDRTPEDEARENLEYEGCPPCYPPDLEFPLRNPPQEYRGIILYWDSLSGTQGFVLCAQSLDWEQFRRNQATSRRRFQGRSFSDFEDAIRRRRRNYDVQGDVHLQPDPKQQNRLQNWVEFQDYHFREHEKIDREIADLRKRLEDQPQHASVYQGRLDYAERRQKRHDILLRWNEQQRTAMDARHPPLIGGDDHGIVLKAARRPYDPGRRKRQARTRAVIGEAGMSRLKRQHGGRRTQRIAPDAAPVIEHLSPLETDIPSSHEGRQKNPRGAKEAALRQIHPQRVSKARATAKSPLVTQLRGAGQQQPAGRAQPRRRQFPQRSQPTREVKTRSGRVSRKPAR